MPVKSVTVRVPAKVNLQLSVGPRESDGFHNLVSVFQAISIFDEITLTLTPLGSGLVISIIGDHTHGVPVDASNLAAQAAILMGKEFDLDVDAKLEMPPPQSLLLMRSIHLECRGKRCLKLRLN
jgi:4-diphosphocytidyl-2-C-methyl-D-erythritol kinase